MQTQDVTAIERPSLVATLKAASRFCGKPSSYLSNLNHVLLYSDGERLTATGTDSDQAASISTPAMGQVFIAALEPSAILTWLAQVRSDAITIRLPDPGRIEFSAHNQRSRITLLASPAEEFPALPDVESADAIHVQAAAFVEAVKAVLPFAPKESRRSWQRRTPAIHLRVQGQQLIIAACDSVRFNRRDVVLSSHAQGEEIQFAIAPIALANLVKLIAENHFADVELTISKSGKYAHFYAASDGGLPLFSISARLLLDVELNLEKLQAHFDSAAGSFTVETKALNQAIRRLARISKQDSSRVEFHSGHGIVEVRARSNESGQALEEIPADTEGERTRIAFHHERLADILKTIKTDKVRIEYQANPRKVARVAGVLIVPIEAFAVEEAQRLAKREAEEAVAAKADVGALADAVVAQFLELQSRSIFLDLSQAKFKGLDQVIGNNSAWPAETLNLPHDLKAVLRQRIVEELLSRGILEREGDTWQVQANWADAQLKPGEAVRRAQARAALREGVQEAIQKLRSAEKISYVNALLEWHCGPQNEPYPYRGSTLTFMVASDVRSRFKKVLDAVTAQFEPVEQGGQDEQ